MTANLHIRPARQEDIEAITAIYGESVENAYASFELEAPSVREMEHRFVALREKNYPYLAATIEGTIIGYAYASQYRPRPAYSASVESTIYITPSHHRQGIGKALLSALIDACKEQEYKQMLAIIACQSNETTATIPSAALHIDLSFEEVGRIKQVGRKHNLWLDTLILQKAIG